MPAELEAPPAPANANSIPIADLAASFVAKNPLPEPTVRFESDTPPPTEAPKETPPAATPPAVEKPAETPPAEPERPHSDRVRQRLDTEKATLKQKLEETENRLKEFEEYKGKWEETSTKYTELETVAQQREQRIKETEEWYKNEESVLKISPMDLKPVQEARETAKRVLDQFIPTDVSSAEESPLPINPQDFLSRHQGTLLTAVRDWQTVANMENLLAPQKGKLQHLILSTVATALGVPSEHFRQEDVEGKEYTLIDPRHPVYQQLKAHINPLVTATNQFEALKIKAESAPYETAKSVISKRQQEAVALARKNGIGVTGDELKSALAKNPDNHNLQIMAAMESHPEILKELTAEIENEAMVTGHMRRQFDIPVAEPEARDKTGRMLQARFEKRAQEAPLVAPLKKLAVANFAKIRELEQKLAARELELEKLVGQGEPGSSDGGDSTEKPKSVLGDRWSDPVVARTLSKLGLGV